MPTVPIPLFTRSYKNADEAVLVDDAAIQYNGFIDELEGLNIRPGEVLANNTAKRNDGLFMWPDKNFIISVNQGAVTLHTVSGETLVDAYAVGSVTFSGSNIVSFCNSGTRVFMAGGGKINYVSETGVVTELADVDAPNNVTHVAFLDGYILAINGDGKFYWSNIPTITDWSVLDFASAEANPDNTKSLHVVQRQIYILGTVSTEIWENDGSSPFVRIPGGAIEVGCAAKYSPIKRGNTLMWLSHTREFVQFTGTDVEFISSRYNKEIAKFSDVSDCIGALIHQEGQEFCVFHFPTEQRTLVYNPALEDWSEWGNWDSMGSTWLPYDFRSTAYDLKTGKTFVGKHLAACLVCLNSDSRVDFTSGITSRPFKFLRRTGHIDNGTTKEKRLETLSFKAKRGTGISSGSPKLMLRYRNNGSNTWSNIREINLGDIGDTEHFIHLHRLGIYKSRQYEISATDNVPIVLSNAEAEITVLR